MNEQLVEIRLYGPLRREFGKTYRMAVNSAAEAVRALCSQLPGFEQRVVGHAPGFRIWMANEYLRADDELHHPCGRLVRIVPAVGGRVGAGKILAGAALIGLSFFLPVTPLISGFTTSLSSLAFNAGLGMALTGASQLLAGNPASPVPIEPANNQPSYAFNGPVNTTAQGNAVPLAFGKKIRVGSQVISSGLSVAQLAG